MPFVCSVCGKTHDEYPALAFDAPHYYHILSNDDKAAIATLTEDYCVIEHSDQTDRFIRAVLIMPIVGSEETLHYGIWVSLSEKSFNKYLDDFKEDNEGEGFFGFLCNQIPGYDNTLSLKTDVICGAKGNRPRVYPHQDQLDNPFVYDFYHGVAVEEAERRVHALMDNE